MRRHHWKKLALASLLIIIAAGFVGYGVIEPQTPIGYIIFSARYVFPPTRPNYLQFLTESLRENNDGYVPRAVDEFLVGRLRQRENSAELEAIIDFQVRQSSARWGMAMFSPVFSDSEDEKGEVIGYLIRHVDKYSSEEAASAMVLIEALRRDQQLIKHDINIHYWDDEHQKYVWPSEQRAQAIELFRRWWGDGHQWPKNKPQSPLES